jgi:uncharacterized phiE125 gp8 family phage protein
MKHTRISVSGASLLLPGDVKRHLNMPLDELGDDALLLGLGIAAQDFAETVTGRTLRRSTWQMSDGAWPRGPDILLYGPPVASITSLTYTDAALAVQIVDGASYRLVSGALVPALSLKPGHAWPVGALGAEGWQVEYVAGYTEAASVLPEMRQALLMLVAHWYMNREAVVTGDSGMRVNELPVGLRALLKHLSVR